MRTFIGIAFGILLVLAAERIEAEPLPPVDLADARAVVRALMPLAARDSSDIMVMMNANGTVIVSLHTAQGSKLLGYGADLPAAVASLAAQSNAVVKALGPMLPGQ